MTTPPGTVELRELVLPGLANHHGTLFAGEGLKLMAKAAFLAGRELARTEVVMAAVKNVDFLAPVPVGRALRVRAWVSRIGRSSMTVTVVGEAEAPGLAPHEVLKGVFEMAAIDANGRPVAIDRSHLNEETA